MDTNKRSFKNFLNSNAVALIVLNPMFGFLFSAVPPSSEWFIIFLFFMAITLAELSISYVWWKRGMELTRYNSLTAFLMMLTPLGFFPVFPLLRLTVEVPMFWVFLIIYLLVLFYALFKRELMFQAFHKPSHSRIAKGTFVILLILIILGAIAAISFGPLYESGNDQIGTMVVSGISYVIGLLMTFVSTALLKKPTDIKREINS